MRTRSLGCAVLLLATGGCRYMVEPDDFAGSHADGDASSGPETVDRCGLPHAPHDDCGRCLEEACCEETQVCAADEACGGGHECMLRCPESEDPLACHQGCRLGDPRPHAEDPFIDLLLCATRECPGRCGQCGASDLYLAPACTACLARTMGGCEAFGGCGGDAACARWLTCVGECLEPPCVLECPFEDTEAQAALMAVLPTAAAPCAQACGFGGAWGCVGDYSWGGFAEPSITLRVLVSDAISNQPIPDASVALCFNASPLCEGPYAQATTGEDGWAVLSAEVSSWPMGFPGFFRVAGPGEDSAYVPSLGFRSRPLTTSDEIRSMLMPRATLSSLIGLITAEAPPEGTPVVMATTLDCQGFNSAGVVFSTPVEGLAPVYMSTVGPEPEATATTAAGMALFPAVPIGDEETGLLTVSASLETSGEQVAQLPVVVRRDHLTAVDLYPTSLQ